MDLNEMRLEITDWVELAQDRDKQCAIVNAVMNLRGSYMAELCFSG
jgi:hypothetical protein